MFESIELHERFFRHDCLSFETIFVSVLFFVNAKSRVERFYEEECRVASRRFLGARGRTVGGRPMRRTTRNKSRVPRSHCRCPTPPQEPSRTIPVDSRVAHFSFLYRPFFLRYCPLRSSSQSTSGFTCNAWPVSSAKNFIDEFMFSLFLNLNIRELFSRTE